MKIKVPPVTVFFFAVWVTLAPNISTLITIAAATVHELGHLIAARILKIEIRAITVLPLGADIRFGRLCSYREDMITSPAGAAANLAAVCVFMPFSQNSAAYMFICANIALAVMNMLPIKTLDGGGTLKSLLMTRLPAPRAERICGAVSAVFLFGLWLTAVYMLLRNCAGLSVFALCAAVFLSTLKEDRM